MNRECDNKFEWIKKIRDCKQHEFVYKFELGEYRQCLHCDLSENTDMSMSIELYNLAFPVEDNSEVRFYIGASGCRLGRLGQTHGCAWHTLKDGGKVIVGFMICTTHTWRLW